MSERPSDDEQLQAFLSGDSAISRRYRESSADKPPAHVDAAILATSRWAIGADREPAADTRPAAARETGADGDQPAVAREVRTARTSRRPRRSFFMQWGIPLGTAAVVVVAATLTLLVERDPELQRIRDDYDAAPMDQHGGSEGSVVAQAEPEAAETPAVEPKVAESKVAEPAARVKATPPAPAKPAVKKSAEAKPAAPPRSEKVQSKPAPPKPATQQSAAASEETEVVAQQAATVGTVASQSSEARQPDRAVDEPVARQLSEPAEVNVAPGPGRTEKTEQAFSDAGSVEVQSADDAAVEELAAAKDQAVQADSDAQSQQQAFPGLTTSVPQPAFTQTPQVASQAAGETGAPASLAVDALQDPQEWLDDIEDLLAQNKRTEAIDSLKAFRRKYPDYELPPRLRDLLPADTDSTE
ncbi:MAG: hypothetical protein PVH25_00585 [Burkholderiales bacterium]